MAAAASPSVIKDASFSHAVSRSTELLSCARTALKIGKAQHANDDDRGGTAWWACQEPNDLFLCSWKDQPSTSHLDGLCEDGLSLLRTMEAELEQLETLVRRRGHTNDPTEEISASVRRLEMDAKELSSLVKTGFNFPLSTTQYQRHTQMIASWLESVATQQMDKLKEILKIRANVLAEQAKRQELLNPQGKPQSGANGSGVTTSILHDQKKITTRDTALFNMAPLPKPSNYANGTNRSNDSRADSTNSPQTKSSTTPVYAKVSPYGGGPSTAGGYGGYGGGGYGGAAGSYYGVGGPSTSSAAGMRRRGTTRTNGMSQQQQEEAAQIQMQIQERQQKRQTENRLQEAQQAERTLADLTTMFSKMTNLISQQGEVLEKVEDDVEAGLAEVTLGQQEITNLYELKKGNRALILKLFGLLIFLIIFMRFYKK